MHHLKLTPIALLVSAACCSQFALAQQAPATDIGKIAVEGQAGGTGTGLIVQEETPKARSSVNRKHLDNQAPGSNPYQAIELLPGVQTFSQDATGLFGGGLRVRGFNSDQLGFTINGAPVNDSGSFSVFPQEYTDTDNLCEVFVTQGSTDNEAPHVGATGGNIGMVTCAPRDQFGGRVSQAFGQLGFRRSFVRLDSGKLFDGKFKAYLSYSKARTDKFKGPGKADRDHVDFGAEFRANDQLFFSTSLLWNRALNNNIRSLTYAQIAANGRGFDFSATPPAHLAAGPGTQTEVVPADGYYKFNINPFKNWLWTAKAEFKANKDLTFSAEPYFWYGYGTGGGQLQTVREGTGTNRLGGGIGDLNGDGDTLDTVLAYGSSVTRTYRPGATFKTNARLGAHNLMAGVWFERARHLQTGPRELIDSIGGVADVWLDNRANYIKRVDGTPVQARDQLTLSTGSSIFLQDSFYLVPDKMQVTLGVRDANIRRQFSNYANESNTGAPNTSNAANYQFDKSYHDLLPSVGVRYQINAETQVFANATKNLKAPGNFSFQSLVVGGTFVNGVLTGNTLRTPAVQAETSVNTEVGLRVANDDFTGSVTAFHVDYANRIASAYDPASALNTDYNVGSVKTDGLELEAGLRVTSNWSVYGSATYTDSRMQQNLQTSRTVTEPTAGKKLPDTPTFLGGLSVNYNSASLFGSLQAKYTGRTYSTLVNDQEVAGRTLINLVAGYRFPSFSFLKNPQIQMNVSNAFDKKYVSVNSPSGSQFTLRSLASPVPGAFGPSQPAYYVGAPRFTAVTLRSDF